MDLFTFIIPNTLWSFYQSVVNLFVEPANKQRFDFIWKIYETVYKRDFFYLKKHNFLKKYLVIGCVRVSALSLFLTSLKVENGSGTWVIVARNPVPKMGNAVNLECLHASCYYP